MVINGAQYYSSIMTAKPTAPSKNKIITVEMGDSVTVNDFDTILSTSGLLDCSALALLSNWDESEKKYHNRTLIHMTGGSLEYGLFGIKKENINDILNEYKSKSLDFSVKMILVGGSSSQTNMGLSITIKQDFKDEQFPLYVLMKKANVETVLVGSTGISINPDGSFRIEEDHNNRGILSDIEKKAVLDLT